jgi:hypothetical protein
MTILNTRADHDKLITTLQAMQLPVVVGLEPTGCPASAPMRQIGRVEEGRIYGLVS